ncbi:Crp/Fnr family transcriptional regulator [Aquimarina rhabdastrellae]
MIKTNSSLLNYTDALYATHRFKDRIVKKSFYKNDILLYKDDRIDYVYIIINGLSKCFITEENGKDYVLEFLGKGEIIGEVEFLLNQSTLSTIEAISDVEVYCITQDLFSSLLYTEKEFTSIILKTLAHRVYSTASKASYQQLYPLKYSVIKIILELTAINEQFSKYDLASYLGISIRVLNRIIKELIDTDMILLQHKNILVKDVTKLKELLISFH